MSKAWACSHGQSACLGCVRLWALPLEPLPSFPLPQKNLEVSNIVLCCLGYGIVCWVLESVQTLSAVYSGLNRLPGLRVFNAGGGGARRPSVASYVWHVTERTLKWQNGYGCLLGWSKVVSSEVLAITKGSLAGILSPLLPPGICLPCFPIQPRTASWHVWHRECNELALMKRSAGLAVWSPVEVILAHTVVSVTLQYGCKATKMNFKWIKMAQEGPSEIETPSSRSGVQKRESERWPCGSWESPVLDVHPPCEDAARLLGLPVCEHACLSRISEAYTVHSLLQKRRKPGICVISV